MDNMWLVFVVQKNGRHTVQYLPFRDYSKALTEFMHDGYSVMYESEPLDKSGAEKDFKDKISRYKIGAIAIGNA